MAESPYKEQLDNTTWSYSRIHTYAQCPACYLKSYIEKCDKVENAFSQFGSMCHSILEEYENGDLMEYELATAFDERFVKEVTIDFPPTRYGSMGDKYYEKGKEYFSNFNGFPANWEIIGAEIDAEFLIEDRKMIGFIDLLVRDKEDNKLIVVDHKSKSKFKNETEKQEYAIQLYLYAKWVKENYGEFPKELKFNMFRENEVVTIPFNEEEYNAALNWVTTTINNIYSDVDFWDKIHIQYEQKGMDIDNYKLNDFFCNNLCGCRLHCNRSLEGSELLQIKAM